MYFIITPPQPPHPGKVFGEIICDEREFICSFSSAVSGKFPIYRSVSLKARSQQYIYTVIKCFFLSSRLAAVRNCFSVRRTRQKFGKQSRVEETILGGIENCGDVRRIRRKREKKICYGSSERQSGTQWNHHGVSGRSAEEGTWTEIAHIKNGVEMLHLAVCFSSLVSCKCLQTNLSVHGFVPLTVSSTIARSKGKFIIYRTENNFKTI